MPHPQSEDYPHDYRTGHWLCDECGFVFQKSKLKKRWDGFLVCKDCWETEHPLDIAKKEKLNSPVHNMNNAHKED